MDALMASLLATLLAASDGRLARLVARLIEDHGRTLPVLAVLAASTIVNSALSALGGWWLNSQVGMGVLTLFLAFAAFGAAIGLVWKRPEARLWSERGGWATLGASLFLLQFGDSAQFLIFTLAGTSGNGLWAGVGGSIGLALAILPALFKGPGVYDSVAMQVVRIIAFVLLAFTGVRAVLLAFGIA